MWQCTVCAFIYDSALGLPEEGIAPGTAWDDIPDDWVCPDCGVSKRDFSMEEITAAVVDVAGTTATGSADGPVVIIGAGMAGYTAAKEIRRRDSAVEITVVTTDSGDWYSKPALSNAFAEGQAADDLVLKTADAMADELHLQVLSHSEVVAIDHSDKQVQIRDAEGAIETLPFASLVLATGAQPIQLPLQGNAADRVLQVNSLADYRQFRRRLGDNVAGRRVLILGAGLIGCEFANDLADAGVAVTLVDLAPQALGRLVAPAIGEALQAALSDRGVTSHFSRQVANIDAMPEGEGFLVRLDDDSLIEVDCVLSAVGLRPNTVVAEDLVDAEQGPGFAVDAYLQTKQAGIYAIGDCANYNGSVLPYILPIMHASKALAATLTGSATELVFPVMPVVVKTPALPLVAAPPSRDELDRGAWVVSGDGADLVARFEVGGAGGALRGFALSGTAVAEQAALQKEMQKEMAAVVGLTGKSELKTKHAPLRMSGAFFISGSTFNDLREPVLHRYSDTVRLRLRPALTLVAAG